MNTIKFVFGFYLVCTQTIIGTSRVPVEEKSSVCLICMKYRIIILIIIIISLGKILLSYFANTSRTHARTHARTPAHALATRFPQGFGCFSRIKKLLGRTETRTRDRMYCQTVRTVRDISRDDPARIATCSLRTPTYRQTDRQTYIHTDRQTYRQTYRQTDRQTDRQTYRKTDRQTDRQT